MVTYRNVYRDGYINRLVYTCSLVLSAERAYRPDLGFYPRKRSHDSLESEMARTGKEIHKIGLERLVVPERKEVLKKTEKTPTMKVVSQGHQNQPKKL